MHGTLANLRHERFAQALARGKTGTEAYLLAGYKANDGNASRMKGNERISARVQEIVGRAGERAEVSLERILRELSAIAFSRISKAVTWGPSVQVREEEEDGQRVKSRSRRASGRALPDFDSPFYAGCMLVRPHDGGIDGMLLVGWWPKTRQGFDCGIPHAELAPACEPHKDRIPITVSLGHVAPRSAGAQNPEKTLDRSLLVPDRWTTFAPIGEQRVENEIGRAHV